MQKFSTGISSASGGPATLTQEGNPTKEHPQQEGKKTSGPATPPEDLIEGTIRDGQQEHGPSLVARRRSVFGGGVACSTSACSAGEGRVPREMANPSEFPRLCVLLLHTALTPLLR